MDQVVLNWDEPGRPLIPEDWTYHPQHRWDHVYVDNLNSYGIPADICEACSDYSEGRWVPVSFCPEAKADMERRTGNGWFEK